MEGGENIQKHHMPGLEGFIGNDVKCGGCSNEIYRMRVEVPIVIYDGRLGFDCPFCKWHNHITINEKGFIEIVKEKN